MQLIERYQKLKEIRTILLERFGEEIICAIAYGSTLCDDFYDGSDFDILLFVKHPDFQFLKKIRVLKQIFIKKGTKIDFNVHSEEDLPVNKGECFWHNNRGIFIQTELSLQGLTIIGENPFLIDGKLNERELKTESVKVINSLTYQARKLLINRELTPQERINLMKWCIYGVTYFLAFHGKITKTKRDSLRFFEEKFSELGTPSKFLEAKLKKDISDELIVEAYSFLSKLDKEVYKMWEKKYGRK